MTGQAHQAQKHPVMACIVGIITILCFSAVSSSPSTHVPGDSSEPASRFTRLTLVIIKTVGLRHGVFTKRMHFHFKEVLWVTAIPGNMP